METGRKQTHGSGYPFPALPTRWGHEERHFAQGLRHLFDLLFAFRNSAYPRGIIILTGSDQKPFPFGEWERVNIGIPDVYGWRRK